MEEMQFVPQGLGYKAEGLIEVTGIKKVISILVPKKISQMDG